MNSCATKYLTQDATVHNIIISKRIVIPAKSEVDLSTELEHNNSKEVYGSQLEFLSWGLTRRLE